MNTIVIGCGLSGLMAAFIAKKRGDNVTLIAKGAGSLSLNSGCIDILAYTEKGAVVSPREAIAALDDAHPYKKIGIDNIKSAINEFLAIMLKYGLPYHGSLDEIINVPTAIGTLKPTSFAPKSLDGNELFGVKKIIVIGIENLKDFYNDILADNLSKILTQAKFEPISINLDISSKRDITTIDVAKMLDVEETLNALIYKLKPYASEKNAFILPQILGTKGDRVHKKISSLLKCPVLETTSLPPSVNGIRVLNIFRRAISDIGINFVENAKVFRAIADDDHVQAVVTKNETRERKYEADKFILATGGVFGGGIKLENFKSPHEAIFRLPMWLPEGEENWANEKLFAASPQGFGKSGILTDNMLRPINKNNETIYKNLFIVGGNLGGYDFCFEHSGNGVAISSAYYAAVQDVE